MDPGRFPHTAYSLAPGLQTVCYLPWLKVSVLLRHALSYGIGVVRRVVARVVVVRRVFSTMELRPWGPRGPSSGANQGERRSN